MSITFQEIMAFHPDNPYVYEEILDSLAQLLPFVGAGLTADVYGTWRELLLELGKKLAEPQKQARLADMVDHGEFLDAAQYLEDERTSFNLMNDLIYHFLPQKLDENWKVIQNDALWLLPDLFECPVLTTNYNQAIEKVYRRRGFDSFESLDPTSPDLRGQTTRQRSMPCVFKIHGSFAGYATDYDKLVFTRGQYERHYAEGGSTREALRDFVNARSLLFLGCSLAGDKTLDILKEATNPGAKHFAIMSCTPGEQNARVRELAKAKIRAIVYEDGRYESVRVLLEHLLQDRRFRAGRHASPANPAASPYPHCAADGPGAETRVLMLASGPDDQSRLRLDKEAREIREAIERSGHWGSIVLEDRWAVRTKDLFRELNSLEPAIVHFSGHGTYDGSLVLEDDCGGTQLVAPSAMAMTVASAASGVRLIVFNACFADAQAREVVGHVDAAIGMAAPIGDGAAIFFSSTLYSALGFGRSLDTAFQQAVAALVCSYPTEADVPQLHVADGRDAARIVFVE